MPNMSDFIFIDSIIITLLIVIMLVLLFRLCNITSRRKRRSNDTERYVHDCMVQAFRQQDQELAAKYAEMQSTAAWIESQMDNGNIDLASLIKSAKQRALALVIRDAEDAVAIASNDVLKISTKISHAEAHLSEHISSSADNLAAREAKTLEDLKKRETETVQRLEKAIARLDQLNESLVQKDEPSNQN